MDTQPEIIKVLLVEDDNEADSRKHSLELKFRLQAFGKSFQALEKLEQILIKLFPKV